MFIGLLKPHLYLRVTPVAVDGRHGDASEDTASKQAQISLLEAHLTAVISTVLADLQSLFFSIEVCYMY